MNSGTAPAIATTSRAHARNVVAIASLCMFVGGLNMSIVNIALSTISHEIDASAAQSSWILLANMLASNALMVSFGRLGDLASRRNLFTAGVVVFGLGSVLSAIATNGGVLIAGRAVSGVGSAMMFSTTSAIIARAVPRARIGQAMGIYYACNSAAQLLGPVIGGVMVDTIGWPWMFWINIPFCVLMLVGALRFLPRDAAGHGKDFDMLGSTLVIAIATTFVAMLTQIASRGLDLTYIAVSCACLAVLVPLFIWREARASLPLIDMSLFRDRLFLGTSFTTMLTHLVRFAILILVALIYQSAYGMSATMAGFLVLPIAVGTLIASPLAGTIEMRKGSAWVSTAGAAIGVVAVLFCASMIWWHEAWVLVAIGGALAGAAGGMVQTANASAITKATPPERLGVVGSLRVMIQGTGIVAGTAVALASVTILLPQEGKSAVYAIADAMIPEEFREGLLNGVPIAFGVLLIASLGAVWLSRASYRGYSED
ncbi:MFS transporter [Cumulibacter soli]|uniref:MFS transporter n=1 Tax=Cumulibacter soli TaxID=2546344 RepID=UPI00106790AF|nr:MFS transporter [Cumulibacter soli]